MILHVFDDAFTYRGRIENWIDCTWVEQYNGKGAFTLVTYDTDKYAQLMRRGWHYYRSDRPCAMLAVKVVRDTVKNTITLNGYTGLHVLTRRMIGLPKDYTNVEAGVYDLIDTAFGSVSYVGHAEAKGLDAECEVTIEGVIAWEGITSLLNDCEYGIRALFDRENKRHVIEVYEGADKTYNDQSGGTVLCQEFGNLKNLVVTEDDDLYKNVVYVTGAANNDPRTVYYQYVSPEAVAAGMDAWREVIVRGEDQQEGESNPDWQKRQKQIAIDDLAERKSALCFDLELNAGDFGKKYDLGDKVTCKSKRYGLQFDTRITEYKYTCRAGVETERVTAGEKPLDYVKGEIVKHG